MDGRPSVSQIVGEPVTVRPIRPSCANCVCPTKRNLLRFFSSFLTIQRGGSRTMMKLMLLMSMLLTLTLSGFSQSYQCGGEDPYSPQGRVVNASGHGVNKVEVIYTLFTTGHPSSIEPLVRSADSNFFGYYSTYTPFAICSLSSYIIYATKEINGVKYESQQEFWTPWMQDLTPPTLVLQPIEE